MQQTLLAKASKTKLGLVLTSCQKQRASNLINLVIQLHYKCASVTFRFGQRQKAFT